MLINVRDFATVQDALNAANPGDRLYFPSLAGSSPAFYQAPASGWTINKNLEIYGDGPGAPGDNSGTTIKPNSSNDHVFNITAPRQNLYFHDFKIKMDAQPGTDGTGNGIHCVTTANNKLSEVSIERVTIFNLGNDGIHIEGLNESTAAVVFLRIRDCQVGACRGSGAFLKNCTAAYVTGGYYNANRDFGLYCESTGAIRLYAVSVEGNQIAGSNATFDSQVRLKSCHAFSMIGAHIEEFDNNTSAMTAVTIEFCLGGLVTSCFIGNASNGVANSRGILIISGSRGITVGPNMYNYVDTLLEIYAPDGTNTDCIVMPQMPQNLGALAGTISMPDADGNGNFAFIPSTKTSKVGAGILLPRVTTTVRDSIPAGVLQRGIVLYNATTGKLNFYDGSAWRVVTST